MPLDVIPTGKKYTTRILGAALAVLSIVGYNLWFRATYGPQTSGNALPDFRILSLFDGQVVTLENKAGKVTSLVAKPDESWEATPPWPEPRHGAVLLTERWRALVLNAPDVAASARCLEFDGRSALIYWGKNGALCALDGETETEYTALGDLESDAVVIGPKYISARELAVLSVPAGGGEIHLDILRLEWHTAKAELQITDRHFEMDAPENATEIYTFGVITRDRGLGGFIAGPGELNLLFSIRDTGILASAQLPVSVLSLSPDGKVAQIQTSDAGEGLAQVDWLNLRLHSPAPLPTLGHETFQWSPDSRLMIIGAQSEQGCYVRIYDATARQIVLTEPLRKESPELPIALWYLPDVESTSPPREEPSGP